MLCSRFHQSGKLQHDDGKLSLWIPPQANRIFSVCQIGRAVTDFPVLTGDHLFVELFGEFVPELLPVLNVIEISMLRRWTQLYSDYGILYRPMLGKGQLQGVPYPHSVQFRGNRLSNTRYVFSGCFLCFDSPVI